MKRHATYSVFEVGRDIGRRITARLNDVSAACSAHRYAFL